MSDDPVDYSDARYDEPWPAPDQPVDPADARFYREAVLPYVEAELEDAGYTVELLRRVAIARALKAAAAEFDRRIELFSGVGHWPRSLVVTAGERDRWDRLMAELGLSNIVLGEN